MTKTFERFLRSFSDEELTHFAQEREAVRPPYWRMMRLALQIELNRRSLTVPAELLGSVASGDPETPARSVSA